MGHRLAPQAEADLEDLAYYVFVESGSLDIADRLIESISERFALLGAHPFSVGWVTNG
jgi:plasmid stabilization system protein ParE